MSVEVIHQQIATTGHLLSREIAWRAVEKACEENEFDVILELISDHASVDGPHEVQRPDRVGARCFLANRRMTTRSALISLRERLIQMSALNKATQVPLGAANSEAGHLNAMTADMVHEMSTLLTVLEVAIHEEHFFQILTMEGTEH